MFRTLWGDGGVRKVELAEREGCNERKKRRRGRSNKKIQTRGKREKKEEKATSSLRETPDTTQSQRVGRVCIIFFRGFQLFGVAGETAGNGMLSFELV